MVLLIRYAGHENSNYKIDSCISSSDAHILSGSEDGQVYIWDFVEASPLPTSPF